MTIMSIQVPCDSAFLVIFFKAMYNKTIIRFGFCADILNNQGIILRYIINDQGMTVIIPDSTKT